MRVTVSMDEIDAAPGDTVTFDVTVRNTSDIVEHYVVELLGLPVGGSARAEPEVAKLRPGETATATVRLAIAADAPAAAGLYTLGVLVRSRYRAEVSRCEELPLRLAAVEDIAVRVEPEVATGGREARYLVRLTNGGNLPVRLALSSSDPERRVAASFSPPVVDLPQGATADAYLWVRAPVPWNKEKQRVLTVEAAGAGIRGAGTATFVQRPRLASRVVRAAGMVGAVVLLAGAVLTAALIARSDDPAAEEVAAVPSAAATTAPETAPTTTAPPSPTAEATTAEPEPEPEPPQPRDVDVTRPFGDPADGVLPDDAFRLQGLLISGEPAQGDDPACAGATAVAVRGDATNGRALSAAQPDDADACNEVAVKIKPLAPIMAIAVAVAGDAPRELEVVYRDQTRQVEDDLVLDTDELRGDVDFVLVRGVAQGGRPRPPADLRLIRLLPAG